MQEKNSKFVPIVSVLGHVDHGKTSLLDKIRNTNIIARETGGITQSTASWQVKTPKGNKITFIDTPGHEAFQAMRERGAKVCDIAILVVSADDGVMPQTRESLNFIREQKTPFIVAITKVDLPTAEVDKVKNQLLELEIVPEEFGGEIVVIPVSSKTGQGIDDLLGMISLVAEMNYEGKPNAGDFEAYVIEAKRDASRGVCVFAVVKNGSLKIGELIRTPEAVGKTRGMFDQFGKPVKEVFAGDPVEIIGFENLPLTGSIITKNLSNHAIGENRAEIRKNVSGFPIILKADTSGSLEAILGQLSDLIGVLYAGVGDIIDSDVLSAEPQKAVIVGFNVKVGQNVLKLAEEEKILVYTYKIIYELIKDVEKWQKEKFLEMQEKVLGKAEIIAQFPHGKERIAGCKLLEGRFVKTDKVRIVRGETVLGNIRFSSIKKQKGEVDKIELKGEEFGTYFEPQFDFRIGDVIESYL